MTSARKSASSDSLYFDEDGRPHCEPINKEIYAKIKEHILQYAPSTLYRYRPGNEWDIKNIEEDTIWLSTLKEFNDPFEDKLYIDFEAVAEGLLQSNLEALRLMRLKHIDKNDPIYKNYINDVQTKEAELQEDLVMKRNIIFVIF